MDNYLNTFLEGTGNPSITLKVYIFVAYFAAKVGSNILVASWNLKIATAKNQWFLHSDCW